MDDIIEFITIDEDLDEVKKAIACEQFQFPVISIRGRSMYFNRPARELLENAGAKALRYYTSTNYVIIEPQTTKSFGAFAAPNWKNTNGASVTLPSVLVNEKKIRAGYYKLYRYKDGFAFKRYEPIDLDQAG